MYISWHDIFRLKKFDFVVIEVSSDRERLKLSQKHKDSWDKDFYTLLPDSIEFSSYQAGDYVKKYGSLLKKFMADDSHNVLITDQLILGAIVKDEQRLNFLNFFVKRGKKLIVLAEPGTTQLFEEFLTRTYTIDNTLIQQRTEFENSVKVIKKKVSEVYTPFSDPVNTYQKMKTDGVERI